MCVCVCVCVCVYVCVCVCVCEKVSERVCVSHDLCDHEGERERKLENSNSIVNFVHNRVK